jgi:hypothetical protein
MRINLRAVGTALATATVFAVAAGPAAASGGPSLAKAVGDVHAASGALNQVSKLAASSPAAASKALALGNADLAAAAHQARWLHSRHNLGAAATAFEGVALQYDRQVRTYTSMVASSKGALQASVAQALAPAIAGRTQALGFLGELVPSLPVSAATTATSTITGVIGNAPGEITGLTGLISIGDLPTQIEQLIAQAITTAGGVLTAGITQLEALVPSLPASIQPIVTKVLTTLQGLLGQLTGTLTGTTSTIGGLFGGLIGTELGQITTILQGILGDLPGLPGLGGIFGTGTGTGTGGTGTGTGGILGSLPFGLGSILSGLLGNLGMLIPGL